MANAAAAPQQDVNTTATLYIANCTKQNAIIYYRTRFNDDGSAKDENRRFEAPRQVSIRSGRQEMVGKRNMHMAAAMEIVTQLTRHGFVDAEDVKRTRGKIPFVFNFNKPVPAETIRIANAQNAGLLLAEGSLRRKRAAVAVNDLVVQAAASEAARAGREELDPPNVRVSYEQLEQSENGERTIAEGYRVDPAAGQDRGRGGGGGGGDRSGGGNKGRRR